MISLKNYQEKRSVGGVAGVTDIKKEIFFKDGNGEHHGERPCNLLSTGAILLADVIPGLFIKTLSPFLPFWAA